MAPARAYVSYTEYLRHPKYRAVRQEAIDRAGGKCEMCRLAAVTEAHHLRYPAWGTFDTVDNLLAVCHECHCDIHGTER